MEIVVAITYNYVEFDNNLHTTSIKIPSYVHKSAAKILIIVKASNEEIDRGRLFVDYHGQLFFNCLKYVEKTYPTIPNLMDYSWTVMDWNHYDNTHSNVERVLDYIISKDIDYVWTLYKPAFTALRQYCEYKELTYTNLLGTPVPMSVRGKDLTLFPMLNIDKMFAYKDKVSLCFMLGYLCSNLANGLYKKRIWDIKISTVKAVYIDTIHKFHKLMDYLDNFDVIAVDTETDSLNEVNISMLSIQFAVKKDQGFFLPFYHKDTPFSAEELKIIKKRLYSFFTSNRYRYLVFQNTAFDLNVIRTNLEINFLPFATWNVADGEYAFDENMVLLSHVTEDKDFYYKLDNLAHQYGFEGYNNNTFKKSQRVTIKDVDLNTPGLFEYGVNDVCAPIGLFEMQIKRAKYFKHDQYENLMAQFSDTQHVFSVMNNTGALIDKNWVWYLDSKDSPFIVERKKIEQELLSLPEIAEAEKLIRKKSGVPTTGLYGAVKTSIFSLATKVHCQTLFFDVLKLDKVSIGKNGTPNINKAFFNKYQTHPVVSIFAKRNSINTLVNNFVKGTLRTLSEDPDAVDSRVRSSYNYLTILTARTSSSDPNLQQIPTRGPMAKNILRMFIAPEGHVIFKADFAAAEIRCVANKEGVSGKNSLAASFFPGIVLRKQFLKTPSDEIRLAIAVKGDSHMSNASIFFGFDLNNKTLEQIKEFKQFRDQIKAVIFGIIYGSGPTTVAGRIGQTVEYTKNLIDNFFKRFAATKRLLETVMADAAKNYFVENQLGFRRHLWAYLAPEEWKYSNGLYAACNRRSVNSVIQSTASMLAYSGIRLLEESVARKYGKTGVLPIRIFNQVHDACMVECKYSEIFTAVHLIRHCMTDGLMQKSVNRHGNNISFPCPMEVDLEVGGSLGYAKKFDGKLEDLHRDLISILEWQRNELKYCIDIPAVMDSIWGENGEKVPTEFAQQLGTFFDYKKARAELYKKYSK